MCTVVRCWAAGCLVLAGVAHAEVLEADENGFVSAHRIEIAAPPMRVFDAMVDEVGRWWDPAHSYFGDAANLHLDSVTGLTEILGLGEANETVVWHMDIAFWHRGKTLVLTGGLGPLLRLGVSGSMSFDFEATETGTRINYRYTVSGRNVSAWAEPVDRVQLGQLMRLKSYVETGSPVAE